MWLRHRVILHSTVIAVPLLILGASGAWYVLRLQRQNSEILDVNVASMRAAEEMEIIIREMRHDLEQFRLTQDGGHLARALDKERDLESWVDQARVLSKSEGEEAFAMEIRHGLDEFFSRLRQEIDASGESVSIDGIERLAEETLTRRVLPTARQYLDLNEQELQDSNQQNKALAERLALALFLLGTCGAIAGLVAGYGVARGISRSAFQLSVPIRDVAGKLNEIVGPIDVSADPSLADLETALQTVVTNVSAVVEQLHTRHREVIRADQLAAVGQLAAGLAHEVRNPLMCMKTLVQSSRRRGEAAQLDALDLRVLDEEITRVDKLLQSFLDFARPPVPETHDVDLAHIVRQTTELLSKKAESRDVTIDCRLPVGPLLVQADTAQLRQVLLNLLLNALDAVDNGGKIWVEATVDVNKHPNRDANGRHQPFVCLRVADNGPGLSSEDRSRIYEPFFSTKETGLGLGLAISQRIVDAHGGKLVALDHEGAGAVFEIRLPL